MLDIKLFREKPGAVIDALVKRGQAVSRAESAVASVLQADEARRANLVRLQEAQERRNSAARDIGKALAAKDSLLFDELKAKVSSLKEVVKDGEELERRHDGDISAALASIPNIPLEDVPAGADEKSNVEIRRWGDRPRFGFTPREHFEIGEALGMLDFEAAGKMSGSRFSVLKGQLARMARALGQFMLDVHVDENGYTEIQPPLLVRDEAVFGTGQLPKFTDDLFRTTDGRWLIPTAEVPLTNLVREQILGHGTLPLRYTALTPCFRSEAGAAGRDVRGMLRQHQFDKVEMVSVTDEESSLTELERMTQCAEGVLKRLGLPFRTVLLCAGDMGFGARKTYDVEVWLPGQNAYREISSCSVCGDFQARRMNARYRPEGGKGTRFVHTLNGSGIAVGRALIAVMENYQNKDGTITVPEALRSYMGNAATIG